MPDNTVKLALRAALRQNEIGTGNPCRVCFTGEDKSGASLGFTQGDMAAEQAVVQGNFQKTLADSGIPADQAAYMAAGQ